MRPCRWIAAGALAFLSSCDLGTAAVLLMKDNDGSGGSTQVETLPALEYRAWVASISDADAASAALVASNGNPQGPWTEVDSGAGTSVFDPEAPPASINAVLIQSTSATNVLLDAIEILDAQDRVLEHASAPTWSNLVTLANAMTGPPDGVGAIVAGGNGVNAFIFTLYGGPIDRFRVNARAENAPPAPGDVVAAGGYSSAFDERPGGLAIDSNGLIHLTLGVNGTVNLARYSLDGAFVDEVELAQGVTAVEGSHAVALDASDVIFAAVTAGDGFVLVRQVQPDLSLGWSQSFSSGRSSDRVEANGIAVDAAGDVIVAGGMDSPQGLNHWLAKASGADGAVAFDFRPGGAGDTYWRATSADPNNLIYTTGDFTSGLLEVVRILTARFTSLGVPAWEATSGDSDPPDDLGRAVALDAAGNLYMAGFEGTTAEGRNGFLVRYGSSGALSAVTTYNGLENLDDEIADIAVDADGSIYAVGYETVTGQGENIWVRKFDANLTPVWTRTHDGGFGDDRAISVALTEDQVVVAGFETVSSGQTKLVLRVYAK